METLDVTVPLNAAVVVEPDCSLRDALSCGCLSTAMVGEGGCFRMLTSVCAWDVLHDSGVGS